MNKRRLVVVCVLVVGIAAAIVAAVANTKPLRPVEINIKQPGVSVSVYDSRLALVGTLSSSGTLSLPEGRYTISPRGVNYASDEISVDVTERGAKTAVDPSYTQTYLKELLEEELSDVHAAINTRYPMIATESYALGEGILLNHGEWYATTITEPAPSPSEFGDTYRVVLKKTGNLWGVVTTPQIVLSIKDYPSIPKSVLTAANQLPIPL